VIRHAPETFKNIIHQATSFIDVFWNNVFSNHLISTPEQLAKTEKDALEMVQKIQDETIRGLYHKEIKYRFKQLDYSLKNPNYKVKKKIKITLPDTDKILLAYLYAYPMELAQYMDEITNMDGFNDIREKALINGWIDAVSMGNFPLVPETEKDLMMSIDRIKKQKSATDVCDEVAHIINNLKFKEIQNLFQKKQQEYFKTENPEIKKEIDALRDELEKFSNQDE